jgi:hypothetical protein
MAFEINRLLKKLDKIGKYSLPLCKHEDSSISDKAQQINKLAWELHIELERTDFKKDPDKEEPIIRFL